MIGNDVVDLNLAKVQSNWQRKGFLEKQFTEKEQKIILNSNNPFQQVWLFWSMKEAAYKCYTQKHQKIFFSPKKISCKKCLNQSNIVKIKNEKYYLKYIISNNYIYTIASDKQNIKMVLSLFLTEKKECAAKMFEAKINAIFPFEIQLKKNEIGIPYLYKKDEKLPFSISKTHHGKYSAFVISLS